MFARATTSKLAQRTLDALRLTRSFVLLEDDYDVDWEVDPNEPRAHDHPHRAPLRGPGRRSRRAHERRAGTPAPISAVCLSPVNPPARARDERPSRTTTSRPRAARTFK
ncbi:MAG TPA: hypothetical protein VGX69_08265 [Solirubrobacteraceae bacterium]|nr:hypothetical protein [Solirubrobacteraceae bacterium]